MGLDQHHPQKSSDVHRTSAQPHSIASRMEESTRTFSLSNELFRDLRLLRESLQ